MQSNKKSFKGQKVYVGIDVHLKKWHVTCLTESNYKRTIEQPACAEALRIFLERNFKDADFHAAYEAGFSGFSTYYALESRGIHTVVVNAADIPSSQYDKIMKTDKVDSEKIAVALKAGLLKGLYVRSFDNLDDVSLVRLRKSIRNEESANKVRVKMLLYTNGISIPQELSRRWTRAFVEWLKSDIQLLSETRRTLDQLIDHVGILHSEYLKVNRQVRGLWRSDKYRERMHLLLSIPGIGATTAITFLTEIGEFSRFRNEREFASYLGLVPSSHNSGDKVLQRTMTFRGNNRLGAVLTEAAWKSIAKDISLGLYFVNCKKRMPANKAIVKVARRLSNIIFSIMKSNNKYDPAKVK